MVNEAFQNALFGNASFPNQALGDSSQFPRSVIRIKKNYQTSDYNPALIPYFGYLKMEKSKFFNTGFFSNRDFKVSTLYSKANNEK